MAVLKLTCVGQNLDWAENPVDVFAGNVKIDSIQFEFCPLWDGFAKTVVFSKAGIDPIQVILNDDCICEIPPEVEETSGTLFIGAYGIKGEQRRTTSLKSFYLKKGTPTDGRPPEPPTPDLYQQLLSLCNEAMQTANSAKTEVEDLYYEAAGKNLFDPTKAKENTYLNNKGVEVTTSTKYAMTERYYLEKGEALTVFPAYRFCSVFGTDGKHITPQVEGVKTSANDAENTAIAYTATQDCYVVFSLWQYKEENSDPVVYHIHEKQMIESGDTSKNPSSYEPYGAGERCLDEIFALNKKQKAYVNSNNRLHGKKWAICGDSFSEGLNIGKIQDGKYKGENAAYGYLIGNRNEMEIQNLFKGGRTLAKAKFDTDGNPLDPSANTNTLIDQYQKIDDDVDFITIYLGINDKHCNTDYKKENNADGEDTTGRLYLGSENDTATNTFYGAWNTILPWLIENRPFAHIGIIVSNGSHNDYRLATIAIAKKYGLPYIDLIGDERTPAMLRSVNPDIPKEIKALRTAAQSISADNTHPNAEAHKFESYIIEDFLKSI